MKFLIFVLALTSINEWTISSFANPCIIKKGTIELFDPRHSLIAYNGTDGGLLLILYRHDGAGSVTRQVPCERNSCQKKMRKITAALSKLSTEGRAAFFDSSSTSQWNIGRAGEPTTVFIGCDDGPRPFEYRDNNVGYPAAPGAAR